MVEGMQRRRRTGIGKREKLEDKYTAEGRQKTVDRRRERGDIEKGDGRWEDGRREIG
jgi:hypothetical protein